MRIEVKGPRLLPAQIPAGEPDLEIDGHDLEDVSALTGRAGITRLRFVYCPKLRSLRGIGEMPDLEQLEINGEVFSLEGLRGSPLHSLTFYRQATDPAPDLLEPLADLPNLRTLHANPYGEVGLAPLAGLRLDALGLAAQDHTDLSVLGGLRVTSLMLGLTHTFETRSDLSPLAAIEGLEKLEINSPGHQDLSFLARCASLKVFHGTGVLDARQVALPPSLEEAHFSMKALDDYSGFESATLRELELRQAPGYIPSENHPVAKDFSALNLPALEGLSVVGVRLSDLGFLSRSPALKRVYFGACNLYEADLAPLIALGALRSLNLIETRVASWGFLPAMQLDDLTLPPFADEVAVQAFRAAYPQAKVTHYTPADPWGN